MNCPVCRVPLIVVERQGIEVDWCPDCGGLWFDEGELELLAERCGKEVDPPGAVLGSPTAATGRRKCPRCRRTMTTGRLGKLEGRLEIDGCYSHGLWFDRGELGSVLRGAIDRDEVEPSPMVNFLGETFRADGPRGTSRVEGRRE